MTRYRRMTAAYNNAASVLQVPASAVTNIAAAVDMINADSRSEADIMSRDRDSERMLPYWTKAGDIVEGYDKIKAEGAKYLPKFEDEEQLDFDNRLKFTKFTNIFRDTCEGLAAKPFEEEITLISGENDAKPPQTLVDFCENVDGAGNSITMFGAATFFNGIAFALDWIFVDYPKADPSIVTEADRKAKAVRPYWSHVLGINVLSAKSSIVKGSEELTYIKIYEPGKPDHVRIFIREGDTVIFEWWEKTEAVGPDGKHIWIKVDGGPITINRIPLEPFITGRRDGRTFYIYPAMKDAADLQIDHYQQESGLKFAKTLTAYPMLAGAGVKPEMMSDNKTPKKIRVGPSRVLYTRPDGEGRHGEWKYVEPSANSLKFLADDIKTTDQQLRELGRQPLTMSSGNLTVITTAVAAGKSRSAVSAWALALKSVLERCLTITRLWEGETDEYKPQVNVYTEFDAFDAEGKDLEALNQARERGDISQETYLTELKRRKVFAPEFSVEKERERILNETPADTGEDDEDEDKKQPKVKTKEPQK